MRLINNVNKEKYQEKILKQTKNKRKRGTEIKIENNKSLFVECQECENTKVNRHHGIFVNGIT